MCVMFAVKDFHMNLLLYMNFDDIARNITLNSKSW